MGYRRFDDRDGNTWEVREDATTGWRFEPVSGNPHPARTVTPPRYQADPFELSAQELQQLIEGEARERTKPANNPFLD